MTRGPHVQCVSSDASGIGSHPWRQSVTHRDLGDGAWSRHRDRRQGGASRAGSKFGSYTFGLEIMPDGVPEAHNPENEEFGDERLQQLLRETAHLPANDISARISAEMKNWIRDAEQYDDLTFIVMKVR